MGLKVETKDRLCIETKEIIKYIYMVPTLRQYNQLYIKSKDSLIGVKLLRKGKQGGVNLSLSSC